MKTGKTNDPYCSFRFLFEIQGLIKGGFTEVSGLQVEVETEDYQEGGVNEFVRKLPKTTKYPNLILKRGITDSEILWNWHQDVVNGIIERRTGYIIMLDHSAQKVGTEILRWTIKETFPVKWTGPEFKANSSTVAIETLELVHEGIDKA